MLPTQRVCDAHAKSPTPLPRPSHDLIPYFNVQCGLGIQIFIECLLLWIGMGAECA